MATRKMLKDLEINETSGVDHPAHLYEGWVVMKQADLDATLDAAQTTGSNQGDNMADKPAEAPEMSDELRKELTDLRKQLDSVREENTVLKAQHDMIVETRALEKATEACKAFSNIPGFQAETFAPVLREIRKNSPEAADLVEATLNAASLALGETKIFEETGTTATSNSGAGADAWAEIEALANDLVSAGAAPTFAKAVTIVAERNHTLYDRYLTEKGI
jgi:hypothetical protein